MAEMVAAALSEAERAAEDEENLERQLDEVEALRAILLDDDGDCVECAHVGNNRLRLRVHVPQPEAEKASSSASRIVLVAELPRGYPSRSPPDLQLSTSTGETVPAEIAEGALVAFDPWDATVLPNACDSGMEFRKRLRRD